MLRGHGSRSYPTYEEMPSPYCSSGGRWHGASPLLLAYKKHRTVTRGGWNKSPGFARLPCRIKRTGPPDESEGPVRESDSFARSTNRSNERVTYGAVCLSHEGLGWTHSTWTADTRTRSRREPEGGSRTERRQPGHCPSNRHCKPEHHHRSSHHHCNRRCSHRCSRCNDDDDGTGRSNDDDGRSKPEPSNHRNHHRRSRPSKRSHHNDDGGSRPRPSCRRPPGRYRPPRRTSRCRKTMHDSY
jgi:hypothetical protein